MKLLCVILACGWISTFAWYHELDMRQAANARQDDDRWHAQLEAFGIYLDALNKDTDAIKIHGEISQKMIDWMKIKSEAR